jgi:hypothetical protein
MNKHLSSSTEEGLGGSEKAVEEDYEVRKNEAELSEEDLDKLLTSAAHLYRNWKKLDSVLEEDVKKIVIKLTAILIRR